MGTPHRFCDVRNLTETLAEPLGPEDQTVQSMADVSPTKWHRAHVTWFFEEFVLGPTIESYGVFHPQYSYLFNSYYEAVGPRHPRARRGAVSRPTVDDVTAYRRAVDVAMIDMLDAGVDDEVAALVELGLHHEQQHQELLLMDAKHVLSQSVLDPVYRKGGAPNPHDDRPVGWIEHDGGLVEIGAEEHAFAYDNELPRHRVHLEPFALADRPVTCGEWLEFIDDGGYERPELWLSDGWAEVCAGTFDAPMYWRDDGDWSVFTLHGRVPLDPQEPVCHVSYYEADAFAQWAGARLPTEAEWEVVASQYTDGPDFDTERLHPVAAGPEPEFFGRVWEWTSSSYSPYPGFRPGPGAIGEYNGKFMVGQQVLRGGCCATPPGHIRSTYRNFFPPPARWAFSGLRLARD
ncbi:MAG: ergothioneine biosynthesis protein EgtB [Acidimicrobiales bacterium]|nr:ergothioneine biosynthesis protein EgtB [Acidimicrobiales bacterium]